METENRNDFDKLLPDLIDVPKKWKYTESWKNSVRDSHPWKEINDRCAHTQACYEILYFINSYGEKILDKIKIQNSYITKIKSKNIDIWKIKKTDIDWQMGYSWQAIINQYNDLFELYNADEASSEVVDILKEIECLMNLGHAHSVKILNYIEHNKQNSNNTQIENKNFQVKNNLWDSIDINHSKIESGFIYVLTNLLMPGVFKIGFTASNPDKRAKEISKKYGLPTPFEVLKYWRTKDPYIFEQRIHDELEEYRKSGEFFSADKEIIFAVIEKNINQQ